MTLDKVNRQNALIKYNLRHQTNGTTYASVAKLKTTAENTLKSPLRQNIDYSEVLKTNKTTKPTSLDNTSTVSEPKPITKTFVDNKDTRTNKSISTSELQTSFRPPTKTTILPIRTPKRLKRQLKEEG